MYKIIGVDQKEYGPVTIEQMRQWIAEGRVNGQTLVWSETSGNWKPLSTFPEFASALPQQSVPPGGYTPPPGGTPGKKIPNYLVQAILVTICCCLPFGIVAIVYAAQVNSKEQAGDYRAAQEASDKAKLWCWVGFGAGILLAVFYAIMAAAGAGAR
ncbi:MAG: CD225/dispanin family protein [Limisphaerales bacterium]